MANNNSSNVTVNLSTVLLVIFVVLKLTHNIDWSWWWVLAPLWIPLAFLVLIFLVIGIAALVARYTVNRTENKLDADDEDDDL